MKEDTIVNRNHKDRLFRKLFDGSDNKENLLSLYNAVNDTDYTDASALEITTLEDAIYLGMKNDVSFLIESTMNIYEHQSTFCPNMPLRGLCYAAKLYEQYIDKNSLNVYGRRKIEIPIPKYMVFYNGEDRLPDRMKLLLSQMFELKEKNTEGEFQWTATMLNINAGHNQELMERCRPLYEYAVFMGKIRTYQETLPLAVAADQAVEECIKEGILETFLRKHRAEVKDLILTEYDEQKVRNAFYEDGRAEGREEGISLGLEQGMERGLKIAKDVLALSAQGKSVEEIAKECHLSEEIVEKILK